MLLLHNSVTAWLIVLGMRRVKEVRTRMDVVAVEEDSLTRLRFPQSWSPSLPDQKSQQ